MQDITISVPEWDAPADAPPADKTAFDDWRTRLMEHERLHEQLDRDSLATKFKAKIQDNEKAVACDDTREKAVRRAAKQLDAHIQAAFMEAVLKKTLCWS